MSCIPYRLFVLYGKSSQSLEIEGNALFVDLLVGFAVYTHVLRVLGIEGMSLCSYLDILELHVLSTVDHDALFGIVHLQVLDADVLNRHLGQTVEVSSTAGCTADDMVDVDVAEARSSLVDLEYLYLLVLGLVAIVENLNSRLASIIKVEGDYVGLNVEHRHILDEDVLYYAATTTCALESQTYIGTEELAVGNHHVLHTTAHLASYNESAMTLEDCTSVYDDVLARNATLSSVGIFTALDTDTVVAYVESRIDDECVLA